jgi:Kef-type K+ transport system membrane component KefB
MQFGLLNSRLVNTVITAAVVNDIMSLVVLSIILQVAADECRGQVRLGDLIVSEVNIAIFLGGIFCSTSCYGKLPAGYKRK